MNDDDLDDLVCFVVSPNGGTVHRWDCSKRRRWQNTGWRPEMSGLDDRPCPECLPDGLPA